VQEPLGALLALKWLRVVLVAVAVAFAADIATDAIWGNADLNAATFIVVFVLALGLGVFRQRVRRTPSPTAASRLRRFSAAEPRTGPVSHVITWLTRVVVGVAAAGSLVLLVLAFGDFRRELVIGAIVLVVPLAIYLVVRAVRSRMRQSRWSRGALGLLAAAVVALAFVVSASGYRAWVWSTCLERVGPEGDLHGCVLRGEDLQSVDLSGADLTAADLSGADLSNADLSAADLGSAELSRANLSDANLQSAILEDAVLTGADLLRADLRGADLSGADLSDADLQEARLGHAVVSEASFVGASLAFANLTSVNGSGADFARANLRRANLAFANLRGVNGSGADFARASLLRADLAGANLAGASLAGVNAAEADFIGARLRGVALEGATLEGATGLTDASLSSALNVDPADLARALWEKRLFLEPPNEIAATLGAACRGTRVPRAGSSRSKGTVLSVLSDNGRSRLENIRWGLQPVATRFAELVACVGPTESITIQICGGYVLTSTNTPASPIRRYQERRQVRLVRARTAALVAEQTFEGPYPDSCPFSAPSDVTTEGRPLAPSAVSRGIATMVAASPAR